MEIVRTENLKKYFGEGDNLVKAVDGISLSIEKGSFTAIVGKSGSGKTTFLQLLGGLILPTGGRLWVEGKELEGLNETQRTIFRRRRIGFVFQSYNLVSSFDVLENIVLPLELDGKRPDMDFVKEILRELEMEEKIHAMPRELSGGQQQRVAIARALVHRPALLLADEPTGNLDTKSGQGVLRLLRRSNDLFGQTLVMITHNEEISQMADSCFHLSDGKLVESR